MSWLHSGRLTAALPPCICQGSTISSDYHLIQSSNSLLITQFIKKAKAVSGPWPEEARFQAALTMRGISDEASSFPLCPRESLRYQSTRVHFSARQLLNPSLFLQGWYAFLQTPVHTPVWMYPSVNCRMSVLSVEFPAINNMGNT